VVLYTVRIENMGRVEGRHQATGAFEMWICRRLERVNSVQMNRYYTEDGTNFLNGIIRRVKYREVQVYTI